MCCDIRSPLTLRIMGLGVSLHEAERLAAFIMTGVVFVVTIMGYAAFLPGNENQPGQRTRTCSDTAGIHTGMTGSQRSGCKCTIVDARKEHSCLFDDIRRVPA
jgi:hypothetical protein